MSWTYSGDPSLNLKDAVRFTIGDTDCEDPLLLDGEINYVLAQTGSFLFPASIRACEAIMTKFARLADESVGQVKISYSQKYQAYTKMKDMLRQRIAIEGVSPYAGGISKTDKQTTELNNDRVKPEFKKHQMENDQIAPWTSQPIGEFGNGGGD